MARRLGVLLALLSVLLMVRGIWSGGAQWGPGTDPARAAADWQVSTDTTGPLMPDVAIAGALLTQKLQSASWSLGISDFLADLAPNTALLSFVGQVAGTPGDSVVISTALGVAWSGRLDTRTETRDVAGDYWTTVTATDRLGSLGEAGAAAFSINPYYIAGTNTLKVIGEAIALASGVTIEIVDNSVGGLPLVDDAAGTYQDPYTGNLLPYISELAKASNTMLAMTRDGRFSAVTRKSETPSSVLTLTGVNAPQSWTLATSIEVDINKWRAPLAGATDAADVLLYGQRVYDAMSFDASNGGGVPAVFGDWWAYGGSQRPVASGDLLVSSWSQTALILLDPFQWVTESGTAWQVMSVKHDVSVGQAWRVSITADNLLDLL